jgi:hemerythrin-like metal-binding protein
MGKAMSPVVISSEPLDSKQLDAMHDHIFARLRQTQSLAGEAFSASFTELVAAIEQDFRREEQLMETFQCPDSHQHREQHARMQSGLHHAAATLMHGDDGPAREALSALEDWLPYHISTQDRHLVSALRSALS